MSNRSGSTTVPSGEQLFDRYLLPKVALTIILVASLVGTWVTTTLAGEAGVTVAVTTWAYLVALGVLVGGLLWKHLFVRPGDLGTGAREYSEAMYDRFDRIAAGALIVFALGGSVVAWRYVEAFGPTPLVATFVVLLVAVVVLVVGSTLRDRSVESAFRSHVGLGALGVTVLALVVTGVTEAALRGLGPVDVAVRVLHLLAFAVWLGGAVWNIFVAVPSGQERPRAAVVAAAGEQLERFRWAVRFVIPTIVLTGIYQAIGALGPSIPSYVGTLVGLAIVAKLALIGVLVIIFKLCPMWRACSPIEGVCDLEELGGANPADRDREVTTDE